MPCSNILLMRFKKGLRLKGVRDWGSKFKTSLFPCTYISERAHDRSPWYRIVLLTAEGRQGCVCVCEMGMGVLEKTHAP